MLAQGRAGCNHALCYASAHGRYRFSHQMKKLNWLPDISAEEFAEIDRTFWEKLSKEAYPVSHGAFRIPISLEPFVLSEAQHQALSTSVLLLISAARKLVEAYFTDTDLQATLAVDPSERVLIEASKDDPLVGVLRLDIFYTGNLSVVEINADFPDGLFMHDVTAGAIAGLLPKKVSSPQNAGLFTELLNAEGVKKDNHIFIGYDAERIFVDEFELCRIKLAQAGWNAISVGAFEELTFEYGVCFFENKPVHVIRRGAELSKLRHNSALLEGLLAAKHTSGLKIINNFKMRLLGHKSLLATLHDPRFSHYLTEAELLAVHELVPKTSKLEHSDIAMLKKEKGEWVLKPSDLTEGKGICIGSSSSQTQWEESLDSALQTKSSWIVQKKVFLPEEMFTLLDESGGRKKVKAFYDLDPHVILFPDHNALGNILVRFSSSEVLNVMKGGGITYAYQVTQ